MSSYSDDDRATYPEFEEEVSKEPALITYGTDLTALARLGKLDDCFGREKELRQLMEILIRRQKNNPVLVGDAGVGKTAIVELFASRLVQRSVPFILEGRVLIAVDLAKMLAGSRYRGEFELRFRKFIKEVLAEPNIIIFIDEIHTLSGTGSAEGSLDAANMLKPILSRSGFQCIGATTGKEYQRIEKDPALNRRFQPIVVAEPSIEDTMNILYNLRPTLEGFHNIQFLDSTIRAAAELSSRYITDRFLPDKAIDLLDRAGARKVLSLTNTREYDAIKAFLNITLVNLRRLRDEAYRRGDIASQYIFLEIENVYSTALINWFENPEKLRTSLASDELFLQSNPGIDKLRFLEGVGTEGIPTGELTLPSSSPSEKSTSTLSLVEKTKVPSTFRKNPKKKVKKTKVLNLSSLEGFPALDQFKVFFNLPSQINEPFLFFPKKSFTKEIKRTIVKSESLTEVSQFFLPIYTDLIEVTNFLASTPSKKSRKKLGELFLSTFFAEGKTKKSHSFWLRNLKQIRNFPEILTDLEAKNSFDFERQKNSFQNLLSDKHSFFSFSESLIKRLDKFQKKELQNFIPFWLVGSVSAPIFSFFPLQNSSLKGRKGKNSPFSSLEKLEILTSSLSQEIFGLSGSQEKFDFVSKKTRKTSIFSKEKGLSLLLGGYKIRSSQTSKDCEPSFSPPFFEHVRKKGKDYFFSFYQLEKLFPFQNHLLEALAFFEPYLEASIQKSVFLFGKNRKKREKSSLSKEITFYYLFSPNSFFENSFRKKSNLDLTRIFASLLSNRHKNRSKNLISNQTFLKFVDFEEVVNLERYLLPFLQKERRRFHYSSLLKGSNLSRISLLKEKKDLLFSFSEKIGKRNEKVEKFQESNSLISKTVFSLFLLKKRLFSKYSSSSLVSLKIRGYWKKSLFLSGSSLLLAKGEEKKVEKDKNQKISTEWKNFLEFWSEDNFDQEKTENQNLRVSSFSDQSFSEIFRFFEEKVVASKDFSKKTNKVKKELKVDEDFLTSSLLSFSKANISSNFRQNEKKAQVSIFQSETVLKEGIESLWKKEKENSHKSWKIRKRSNKEKSFNKCSFFLEKKQKSFYDVYSSIFLISEKIEVSIFPEVSSEFEKIFDIFRPDFPYHFQNLPLGVLPYDDRTTFFGKRNRAYYRYTPRILATHEIRKEELKDILSYFKENWFFHSWGNSQLLSFPSPLLRKYSVELESLSTHPLSRFTGVSFWDIGLYELPYERFANPLPSKIFWNEFSTNSDAVFYAYNSESEQLFHLEKIDQLFKLYGNALRPRLGARRIMKYTHFSYDIERRIADYSYLDSFYLKFLRKELTFQRATFLGNQQTQVGLLEKEIEKFFTRYSYLLSSTTWAVHQKEKRVAKKQVEERFLVPSEAFDPKLLSSEKVALTEPPAEDYGLLNVELQEALKLEEKQYHSLSRQLLKDLKSSIVQRADRLLFASDNPISSPNLEVLSLADIQRERLCRRFDLMDVYYTGELKDLSLTRISSYLFSEWFAAKSSKKTSKNLKPSLASKSRLLGNFFVFPGFVFEGYLEEVRKSCQDSGLSYESAYDFFEEDSSKQKIDLDQFTELARTQSAIFVDFFSKMKPLLRKGFIASLLKTAFPIQERETELIKLVLGFYSQQRTQLFLSYIKDHTKLREARTQGGPGIRGVVSDGDINELLGEMTGIPVNSISVDESSKLLELESSLHKRVIGQETAIRAIAKALRRSRLGIQNPNRPIGSFLFCGPTGVGKTEVTKALSERIFGSEKQMIRFDMSEFMEKFTVSRLIGSPPGYVGYEDGGQLTDAVRKKPYSVVLFDEVEKAHPDVLNILLQILEDGRLTDSEKRLIHFDNTIVILTSNAAASEIQEILQEEMSKKQKDSLESEGSSKETFKRKVSAQNQGEYLETHSNLKEFLDSPIQENFLKDLKKKILESLQTIPENLRADYQDFSSDTLLPQSSSKSSKQKPQEREALLKEKVMEKLTTIFLPEFLNRLDDIIVFEPLKPEELRKICTVMIDQLTERVKKKNIFITVDDAVKNKLAQEGYDPMFGARPLRRLVTKYIEDLLSDSFLEYTTKTGSNSGQFFVHVQLNENNEIISTFDSKASLKEKNF